MAMVLCRGCARQMNEAAASCPHCGARKGPANSFQASRTGSAWMGILSLMSGIVCTASLFDVSPWSQTTFAALGMIAATGLVLGTLSIVRRTAGSNWANAGVVLSGVSLCGLIGKAVI